MQQKQESSSKQDNGKQAKLHTQAYGELEDGSRAIEGLWRTMAVCPSHAARPDPAVFNTRNTKHKESMRKASEKHMLLLLVATWYPSTRGVIRTIMSAAAGHPCACPIWGGRAGLLGRRHRRDPRAVSRTCQSQTTGTQAAAHAHSRALFNRRITCRQHPLNNPLSVWPKLTESPVHQPTLP